MKTKIQIKRTLVFALFTLLVSFKGYTQDSQPTKEETITWLKDKLTKHFKNLKPVNNNYGWILSYSLESVDVKECEIIYKVSYSTPFSGGTITKITYTIPTKGLKIYSSYFGLNYDGIKEEETSSISSGGRRNEVGTDYISSLQNYFGINCSGEEDLANRIQKAITHLATFCPEKEKEKF